MVKSQYRGGASAELIQQLNSEGGDLNLYYDRFLRKRVTTNSQYQEVVMETPGGIPDLPEPSNSLTNSILVIDMQNDFILPPCGAPGVPAYPGCGNFSVTHGYKVIEPLSNWLGNNAAKCTKVIFSRDSHDPKHCSFQSEEGPFPDHCQINSPGAELHPSMDRFKALPNAEVIFKGMEITVDSFGAAKYPKNNQYAATRQIGPKCCPGEGGKGGCSDLTGGFYMNGAEKEYTFAAKPFNGQYVWQNNSQNPNFRAFNPLKDLLKGSENTHNIYIVGLAADWCVRDTAFNLGMMARAGAFGSVTVNVYVIHELCRNSFVPVWASGPPGSYTVESFKSINPVKPLTDYAFKIVPKENAPPEWTLLTVDELPSITQARLEKGGDLFKFLNEPADILQNYLDAGVKLIMAKKSANLSSRSNYLGKPIAQGGSRRNRRKRHTKRQRRRSKYQTRR